MFDFSLSRPTPAPQAATQGALLAGQRVAGIRIQREAGTTVLTASYLPSGSQVHCRYLSSRKVALVDSGRLVGMLGFDGARVADMYVVEYAWLDCGRI